MTASEAPRSVQIQPRVLEARRPGLLSGELRHRFGGKGGSGDRCGILGAGGVRPVHQFLCRLLKVVS